jgi:hypothetical protein
MKNTAVYKNVLGQVRRMKKCDVADWLEELIVDNRLLAEIVKGDYENGDKSVIQRNSCSAGK